MIDRRWHPAACRTGAAPGRSSPRGMGAPAATPGLALVFFAVWFGAWGLWAGDDVSVGEQSDSRSAIKVVRRSADGRMITVSIPLTGKTLQTLRETDQRTRRAHLSLHFIGEDQAAGPPIFGKYKIDSRRLLFTPRFALTSGETYLIRAVVNAKQQTLEYLVPQRKAGPSPQVTKVLPGARVLPANHMKFYVYFSQPMREGRDVFDSFQLVDDKGVVVKNPWRRVDLWNSSRTRLTLWIHPGRIKEGLNLRQDEGPVLESGKRYELRVLTTLRDQHGRPLAEPFSRKFSVGAAIKKQVLPAEWKLSRPSAGSRSPLVIRFDRSMDSVLLQRMLAVRGPQGKTLKGVSEVEPSGEVWRFVPTQPWQDGRHEVKVDSGLEDLGGNTPQRIFDLDLQSGSNGSRPQLNLPFRTKTKGVAPDEGQRTNQR